MFASLHRRSRDERGSVTIQMVFLMPALFLLMFLGLQGALYYHAKQVALAAAQEGAREAGSETSPATPVWPRRTRSSTTPEAPT